MARILAVDDDHAIRFFMEELLTRDGHEATVVSSGEAALPLLETTEFDLALIDLRLEGMSGTELLAILRQQAPDTVVIMLTGHGTLESAVEALRQGAHDYLFKPCKTTELRESIRRGLLKRQQKLAQRALLQQLEQQLRTTLQDVYTALGDTAAAPASALTLMPPAAELPEAEGRFLQQAGVIVDVMRHVITVEGQLLEASPTEFALLAYLIREAPRVVSPPELVREIQGYESSPWEARNLIRYYIYRLRQKIKALSGRDLIETVRGVGYTIRISEPTAT